MEGISPEQIRAALVHYGVARSVPGWAEVFAEAARELLALKEAPAHQDYDVALPEIEEWVNRNGTW